jgi:hypothetical protein
VGVGVVLEPLDDREDARERPRSGLGGGDIQATAGKRVTHHLRALWGGPSQLRSNVPERPGKPPGGEQSWEADSHDSAGGAA